jgi:hypothetical protein
VTPQHLTKRTRFITAILAVMFVLYCSVGVCTDLFSVDSSTISNDPHAHHMTKHVEHDVIPQSHCETSESCEWSINPVSDQTASFDAESGFFLAYLISSTSLMFMFYSLLQHQRRRYAYAQSHFYPPSYPRLHLQQSVFLN